MKHVRVTCKQLDDEYPEPLVFDVVLGDDNRPAHKIPFAGWWGKPRSNNWLCPLVFRPDGAVDCGGDPEDSDEDRHWRTPFHETAFFVGTKFYMEDQGDGEVSTFVVTQLTDLFDLSVI